MGAVWSSLAKDTALTNSAVKTVQHLEAYEKLIGSIPPRKIKLTKCVAHFCCS